MKRLLIGLMMLSLLAGCGQGGAGDDGGGANNQADIDFVMGMIPHHQQAIEMATLAKSRSESPEIKALASRIQEAQEPEIEKMNGLLEEWGVESDIGGMDMSGGDTSGMMDEADMQSLESAQGAEFDRMFLEGMIAHHEGAVEAANEELANGQSEEAKALAREIVNAQEVEIEEMRELLAGL